MHHYACNFDYIFLMTNNWHKDTRDRLSFIGGANGENMNWNSFPWRFGLETWREELNENNETNIRTQIKRHKMPQLHLFFVLFFALWHRVCAYSMFLLCLLLTAGVLDIICKLMKRLKSGFSRIMFPIYRKRFKTWGHVELKKSCLRFCLLKCWFYK